MSRAKLLVAAMLMTALTGCGQATQTGAGPATTSPAGPPADRPVLMIDMTGGFTASRQSRWLGLALYPDGRLVFPGAVAAIYPGPAYVPLVQGRLSPTQVEDILDDARPVVRDGVRYDGVGTDADGNTVAVADAQDTRVRVWTGTKYATTTAYALGMTGEKDSRALAEFVTKTQELTHQLADQEPVEVATFEVWARRALIAPQPSGVRLPAPRSWPGAPLAAAAGSENAPDAPACHVEPDGKAIADAAEGADAATLWTDPREPGSRYQLDLVPLLPGEAGCTGELVP